MPPGVGVDVRTRHAEARRDLPGNCLSDFALKCQQVLDVALGPAGPGVKFDSIPALFSAVSSPE